ncbi:MAG: DEAD/DEAH box helicase family protein [Methanobrevibacter sp.]|nr:DEAD/DEAH box helicase family protein [Methanobrevibacter sp.]
MSKWSYSKYSKVLPEVRENFTFNSARKEQLETISEIAEAIDKGYKYIVLEAGTGTGKSAIAATLARMYDSAYILTITKQLQQQYLDDFEEYGFKLVKGRNNFHCKNAINDIGCDHGLCIDLGVSDCIYKVSRESFSEKTIENSCEYLYQKVDGILSDVVITNYTYAYLDLNFDDIGLDHRELMICDEAHNLENQLMKELTLEFERKQFKEDYKLDLISAYNNIKNKSYREWCNFLERLIEKDREMKTLFFNKYNKDHQPSDKSKMNEYSRKIQKLSMFRDYIKNDSKNWVLDNDNQGEFKVFFKPVTINNYSKNALFKHADHVLFMSATILDYKLFAKYLGIREKEIYPIRRKTPFDMTRNPITMYDLNMKHEYIDESSRKALPIIRKILKKHRNEKGIIHTVNNKIVKFIMENIDDDRLISHLNDDREKVLKEFEYSGEPLVLVSPSMDEGVDLPGDKCSFQIIFKVPYLPFETDKQIKKRKSFDQDWYFYRTVLKLIQTYGRGMRFEEDKCETYILDNRLKSLVRYNKDLFPESFLTALSVRNYSVIEYANYRNKKPGYKRPSYTNKMEHDRIFEESYGKAKIGFSSSNSSKPKKSKSDKKPKKKKSSYTKGDLTVTDKMRERAEKIPDAILSHDKRIALMQVDLILDNQKLVEKEGLGEDVKSQIRKDIVVLVKNDIVKQNSVRTAIQTLIKNYK